MTAIPAFRALLASVFAFALASAAASAADAAPATAPGAPGPRETMDRADPEEGLEGPSGSLPAARLRFELHVGRRDMAEGLFALAAERFQRVVASAPEHPGAWLLLSRAQALEGRLGEARESAQKALDVLAALPAEKRAGIKEAEFHYNLGSVLMTMGRLQEAERELRTAVEADPAEARMHYRLGSVLLALGGRDAEAAEELGKAVAIDPRVAPAWRERGQALLRTGDVAGAKQALDEALKREPEDPRTHYVASSVAAAAGDVAAQEAELGRFQELQAEIDRRQSAQSEVDSRIREATSLLAEGKNAEAATAFEAALEDPHVKATGFRRSRILSDLARAKSELGLTAEARDLYLKALAEKPDSFVASFELGVLLGEMGHADAAVPLLVKATRLSPFEAAPHHDLGLAYGMLGRLNEALGELRRAATIDPDDVRVRQQLVNLEWALGHGPQARELVALGGVSLPEGAPPAPPSVEVKPEPPPDDAVAKPKREWAR